ncbi:hypothetical protein FLL45_03850 [Aliikangiella marina]|uniref:Uncharacterized protein n=1 Tax=Aliikangiella marina TaxID=1712262 RepID=A0A545TIQ8_9GAMM|nr:hypothetical protein [Aliikangiella marina]TQV77093.1 hypothetical protein FLL45_03850 [Aliikangiella marina]
MNSSISNSRKIYSKICLGLLALFIAAMGLIHFIVYLHGANASDFLGRVFESKAALPKIVKEEKDLVLMFGSSMTQAGFSPRQFDRLVNAEGKNIKSFNYGFGGLNPFFQDYLSRRIADEFIANDRQLKLAIIEFNPFQTTKTRWAGAIGSIDSYLTILASDEELWEIAKAEPERGALLYNIKYLRRHISAQLITSYYGRGLFPRARRERLEEPKALIDARREAGRELTELFAKEYPDFDDSDWYYPWQGGGTIPEERSARTLEVFKEYYATFQHENMKENYRQNRIASADIEGLNFEPLLIESFIQIVKNFQQFSDKVEVVMLPRGHQWIKYSPEAQARLDATIKQIEAATGITIRNHQLIPEITPEMFSDVTHLARYSGDVAYTNYLVKQYKDQL